jgi:hypothetical protein
LVPEFESIADAAVRRAIQAGLQRIGVIFEVFDKNSGRQEAAVLQNLAARAIPPPHGWRLRRRASRLGI